MSRSKKISLVNESPNNPVKELTRNTKRVHYRARARPRGTPGEWTRLLCSLPFIIRDDPGNFFQLRPSPFAFLTAGGVNNQSQQGFRSEAKAGNEILGEMGSVERMFF